MSEEISQEETPKKGQNLTGKQSTTVGLPGKGQKTPSERPGVGRENSEGVPNPLKKSVKKGPRWSLQE